MNYAETDRQVRSAVVDYERVRSEREPDVDVEVRVIREAIHAQLFDCHLTVGGVLEATGLRDHNVQTRYHSMTGETVWQYVTRCRVEVGAYILVHTSAPIYLVSRTVGYTSSETFTRAFKRVAGVCPLRYRQSHSVPQAEPHRTAGSRQIVK